MEQSRIPFFVRFAWVTPGALPVLNADAIANVLLAGLSCNCKIATYSKFDRKNYFYPDIPKAYQISQYDLPLCYDGHLPILGKGLKEDELIAEKMIGIRRIHLEEDVGKSMHYDDYSAIDFNRAGVPLIEIVSNPDMCSANEAYLYLSTLKQRLQYSKISNCDMEKGQMRCDVNISLMPMDAEKLNRKTEIKNLNSFKAVYHALNYEVKRQSKLLDKGIEFSQETRAWNESNGETYVMRRKEDIHDYRYFPDPDLPPLTISRKDIEMIRRQLPEFPERRKARFMKQYSLSGYDAKILTMSAETANYFESAVQAGADPKKATNWIMTELLRELAKFGRSISESRFTPHHLSSLLMMIDSAMINGKTAKAIFIESFETGTDPRTIVQKKNLTQVSDASSIRSFIKQVISDNPGPVQQYKDGKKSAIQFLIGQVMQRSGGKANPKHVAQQLQNILD